MGVEPIHLDILADLEYKCCTCKIGWNERKNVFHTAKEEACISIRAYYYQPVHLTDLYDSAQTVGRCAEQQE